MKKVLILITLIIGVFSHISAQEIYSTTTGKISFFSSTPAEDIKAENNKVTSILKTNTNEVAFQLQVINFKFPNSLMEEHFNENYMQTSTFPKASFSGKINENIDYTKEGVVNCTATGNLTIHGVTKNVTIAGKLTISKGKIHLDSVFEIALVDYKIEVPTIVFNKIAEKIKVTVAIDYLPKK